VAGGNEQDVKALGKDRRAKVNPMFVYSSSPRDAFVTYYSSDPLIGCHLAEALDGADKIVEKDFDESSVDWCSLN